MTECLANLPVSVKLYSNWDLTLISPLGLLHPNLIFPLFSLKVRLLSQPCFSDPTNLNKYFSQKWVIPQTVVLNVYLVGEITLMLVTDVGDEICWWRLSDSGDIFGHFGDQYRLFFTLALGTNIQTMSPTSKFSHQHPQIVTNFNSSTERCHQISNRRNWVCWISVLEIG